MKGEIIGFQYFCDYDLKEHSDNVNRWIVDNQDPDYGEFVEVHHSAGDNWFKTMLILRRLKKYAI